MKYVAHIGEDPNVDRASTIKDVNNVAKLTLLLDYKKAKKKFEEGFRDPQDFQPWMVSKKSHTFDNLQAATDDLPAGRIDTKDIDLLVKRLQVVQKEIEKVKDKDAIGYQATIQTYRLKDGLGTVELSARATWFVLKDEAVIQRYIRKVTKEEIEKNFGVWRKTNEKRLTNSNVLPKKLLDGILDDTIEWEDFCKNLQHARELQDIQNDAAWAKKQKKALEERAERQRIARQEMEAFNLRHGYPKDMEPWKRKQFNQRKGRTAPTTKSEE